MDKNHTPQDSNQNKQPVRRRRRRRNPYKRLLKALIYVACVLGASVLLAAWGWNLASDVLALNKGNLTAEITLDAEMFDTIEVEEEVEGDDGELTTKVSVEKRLKKGELNNVTEQLEENGLIEYKWVFKLFVNVSNSEGKFQPGTYTLDTSMDYRAIITNLGSTTSNKATVKVTFTEGSTVDQIFSLMEEKGVSTVEELQYVAANHDYAFSFLEDIPLGDYKRLEGYLFPDTYEFYLNDDPTQAINKLLVNFDAKFTDEMRALVAETEYSIRDILTIASMIEKETDGEDEKKVASVIYNRLNHSGETAGFLQIDATIAYVNGGKVTADDIENVDSPYNTYKYKGLPAGPIANPGLAAINAAMEPEATGYYFYVLNPETNRHEYTRTYNEHLALVNKYYGG